MTTSALTNKESRACPDCGQRLYFTGDGRALHCEQCGYKRPFQRPQQANRIKELVMFQRKGVGGNAFPTTNPRLLLRLGVAAAKAGDADEAFYYLERVILTEAGDRDQAQAWLWLSETVDDPAQKRECLEQVLAIDPTHGIARKGLALLDGRIHPDEVIDPNRIANNTPDEPVAADAAIFRCPRCDGHMTYSAGGSTLVCEFCNYQQDVGDNGKPRRQDGRFGQGPWEQDFIAAQFTARGHVQPVAMRSFQCQACAVDFVLSPETISLTCPYCDSVYVTETAETSDLLPPQALIPFAVSQDDAEQRLRRWFKQQTYKRVRLSPIVGIYLPVWTFDAGGELGWSGYVRRGDDWVPKSGSRYVFHDDVLVSATQKLDREFSHWLDDFDLEELTEYDTRYLANWPAERYQITLSDASLVARRRLLKEYRWHPGRLTSEDVSDLRLKTTDLIIESYKLILLPVWLAHYRLEEKTYDVMVNGQNGRLRAQKPQDVIDKLFSWLKGA